MIKRIFAVLAFLSLTVNFQEVIAQPSAEIETNSKTIKKIVQIVEAKSTEPSKKQIAKKLIEQRKKEIEAQKKAQELERKKQEAQNLQATIASKILTAKGNGNVEVWRSEVAKYPWSVEEALLTMKLESGGNPNAVSATNDHGLFQIHNGYTMYGEQIYNPVFNIALAYNNYYKTRGWNPWYAVRGILWN